MTKEKEKSKTEKLKAAYKTALDAAEEKFETGKDIYVTVLENPNDDYGPIIFETYLKNSSKESVEYFCKNVSEKYGKCKIAKVTFVDNN